MNKIFNWTLGSVFRTIGRVIGYLVIGGLFALIMSKSGLKITDLLGIDSIKASTISYDYSKYYVRTTDYPFSNTDNTWSSALYLGEYYNTTDIGYVNSIRARFGVNAKFNANTKYRVKINVKFNNDTDKSIYLNADSIICQGSATSTWSSDENLIDSCKFVARTYYNENKNASYLFDIIPNTNIYGIQIAFYIKGSQYPYWSGDRIQAIRVLSSSNITTDTSTSDTINNSTTEIIYNQNQNTENVINSMLVCKNVDITSANINGYINANGQLVEQTGYNKSTDYINLNGSIITLLEKPNNNKRLCFYKTDKSFINCIEMNSKNVGDIIPIPAQAEYYRMTFDVEDRLPVYKICTNGNQATNESINDLNNTMNNSDSSGAQSEAGDFFSDFSTNTHGLTGIITAPLNAIQSLTSKSCSPLVLPLPFVNQNLTLPCMRAIYVDTFGGFMNIYDIIVIGIISYWIMVRIFAMVKDFKNPEHDEVEVVDL